MADNSTGLNSQYGPGSKFFSQLQDGTGAPGSPGATDADALPDDTWRVPALGPYDSSQVPLPVAGVGADDVNVPAQTALYGTGARDPLTGVEGQGSTGAGQGSAGHFKHPSAGGAQ